MFVLNSNNSASLDSITKVEIYYLDPSARTEENPDGATLVQTIAGGSVLNPDLGQYELDLYLDPGIYTQTGRYIDVWTVVFQSGDAETTVEHLFQVYPDLWYTTPIPIVYDFNFYFQPNKFKVGSKKYIEIEITPNVPRATDLEAYYQNLAIAADISVTISKRCGDCNPCGEDLIKENDPTQYREKNRAFYFIDTTEYDEGIYDIYFTLSFGGNVYVSDTNQFQIYS